MIAKLLLAFALMAFCVAVHAGGVTSAMRWVRRQPDAGGRYWVMTWLFVRVAGWMVLCHLVEIMAWGALYAWRDAMPGWTAAIYFSAVTYTTTGYGDLVLPEAWRMVGGVEALTGILMCGWSTGFFFAVVNQMNDASVRPSRP